MTKFQIGDLVGYKDDLETWGIIIRVYNGKALVYWHYSDKIKALKSNYYSWTISMLEEWQPVRRLRRL